MRRSVISFTVLILLAACSPRAVRSPSPSAAAKNRLPYVDLEPGWRLQVVTPLTRSGRYVIESTSQQNGANITVAANSDFLGYETDYYSVDHRGRDSVKIHFVSAAVTKDGVANPVAQPRVPLFQLPDSDKYVRLLYLKRESQTDHDMAVLAASKRELLSALTDRVQEDPHACRDAQHTYCSWIPAGIAVRPERLHTPPDMNSWEPAR